MSLTMADIPSEEIERLGLGFDKDVSNLFVLLRTNEDATELCHQLDFNGWLSRGLEQQRNRSHENTHTPAQVKK
eukprot:CAMPEP_0195527800 /NCGR_PEP_ID=MMETSP0794_2-20130614/29728_1 /TAXON_ID=515487 /ORGANISM="Stephanopyxis turris, Strain CCMP 815" /LENGTH=73 /DNA_ID=CAMNT_0040658799 /DNA_START=11 /DNA_END=232 /DNA_ORIENTATION=-